MHASDEIGRSVGSAAHALWSTDERGLSLRQNFAGLVTLGPIPEESYSPSYFWSSMLWLHRKSKKCSILAIGTVNVIDVDCIVTLASSPLELWILYTFSMPANSSWFAVRHDLSMSNNRDVDC